MVSTLYSPFALKGDSTVLHIMVTLAILRKTTQPLNIDTQPSQSEKINVMGPKCSQFKSSVKSLGFFSSINVQRVMQDNGMADNLN